MHYCPNDDCPDFVAVGFRQDFPARESVCPDCGTPLVDGEPPADEGAALVAVERRAFDSPIPGILGGSATGVIRPGESETLCQSCAAPVEAGVQFCEKCVELPEEAKREKKFPYRFLHSIRSWWGGNG
jgi:predicted nucleic acid-binding Zn ribbon protein